MYSSWLQQKLRRKKELELLLSTQEYWLQQKLRRKKELELLLSTKLDLSLQVTTGIRENLQ
jgi:hypothetical protein